MFLIRAGIQLSNAGRLELVEMGEDGINVLVGRGQMTGQEHMTDSFLPQPYNLFSDCHFHSEGRD